MMNLCMYNYITHSETPYAWMFVGKAGGMYRANLVELIEKQFLYLGLWYTVKMRYN